MVIIEVIAALLFVTLTVFLINNSYLQAVKKAQKIIIDSLSDAVIALDAHGKIILFNHSAELLTGISQTAAIGKPVDTIIKLYDEQKPIPYLSYRTTNEASETPNQTLLLQKENGNKTQILLTLRTYSLGVGNKTLLLILHDASKEQQLEEMKVDFVSMAAHELRTPLTAIRGYASLLQMHTAPKLDDSSKELVTRLIVSTGNLTNLIDNLLSVSRIERNSLTVETRPIDLKIIIKDIFASFQQQAITRKQKFTLTLPETIPLVMVDPFRIGLVFINLISNALNYTPDQGTITITVTTEKDYLQVVIQDTGEGIPAEAMPRLFTKFFRVSGSLEQGSKGTGLGLYITKSIVELHKGKIWAESIPGKGSTFTFTLPIATDEQKNTHEQQSNNTFLTVKNGQGIIVRKNL